ncbi:MAG TPA: ASKHA domain-containing protein [Thermodesulfovibrionales bacterium]|nr:ASKHA domain-containing protein [Thermodesulfovibrionales bacterium]
MRPLAFPLSLKVSPPSPSDKTADAGRLRRSLDNAGFPGVEIPLPLLRELPRLLRAAGKSETVMQPVLGCTDRGFRLVGLGGERLHGLAVDLGTTNITLVLTDMISGKEIDILDIENPQMSFGDDVLTRVHRSMRGEDLHSPLMNGLNGAVASLCSRNGLHGEDIAAVAAAGNTIMSHFFLNLPVENIPVEPYVPALQSPGFVPSREVGLAVNQEALVYVFPNAGSYVGGDIVAGILATGIYREDEPSLFVDAGTNAEIVLGCRDWLMAGAGAAGPALEGGVSAIGRRAGPGSVEHVRIDKETKEIVLETVGGGEPQGICGSGMIDLVSEMFDAGLIDQRGKFISAEKDYPLLREKPGKLMVSEKEIENFLRSKAAMFTALSVMVRSVGLTFHDISRISVAGALGCGISVEKAVNIGMLPDIDVGCFVSEGNTSLRGARMLLLESERLEDIRKIAAMITYRELNEDGEFMREFPGARFIERRR